MSTLTTTTDAFIPSAAAPKSDRKGFWNTILDAAVASRQRRAEREIAEYVAGHGGLLTDEIEREIMRRATGRTANFRG